MPDPSGSGEKNFELKLDIDPSVIAAMLAHHQITNDDQRFADLQGHSLHLVSVDISGITLAELRSRIGTTEFLPSFNASLVPGDSNNELQTQLHADLIKQTWSQLGRVSLETGLAGELDYQHSSGTSAKLELDQDVKFSSATIEAKLVTDLSSPQPKVEGTVSLKFTF